MLQKTVDLHIFFNPTDKGLFFFGKNGSCTVEISKGHQECAGTSTFEDRHKFRQFVLSIMHKLNQEFGFREVFLQQCGGLSPWLKKRKELGRREKRHA